MRFNPARLVSARKSKGLTQDQLAQALGVIRQLLHKWEHGANAPSGENLNKLAAVLGKSTEWFFEPDSDQAILYRSAPIAPSHAKAVKAARDRQRRAMDMLAQIQADLAKGGDVMPAMAKIAQAQRELVAAQTELERIQ